MKHVLDGRTMMLMKTIIRMKDHFYPCAVSACVCAQFTTDFRKKYFFEISLFKYIHDIENAIKESPPDVLALSNYIWSYNLSSEIFKILKKRLVKISAQENDPPK